ncbi:amino acid adenylation domain-containing protein [Microbacterium sp. NPDC019599]|uniref:amino acid adenylation domain-containing protein n=1 Tax=Microbacterium sp. NPDC019599 TaxID=3154690 RepID=UPI0033F9C232
MSELADLTGGADPAQRRELLRALIAARREEAQVDDPRDLIQDAPPEPPPAIRASAAERSPAGESEHPVAVPERADDRPGAPLSASQRRLWLLHQLNPSSAALNVELVTPIAGAFDPEAMRGALSDVVARHAVLRTRYLEVQGEPRQIVDAAGPLDVPLVDLSVLPPAVAHVELQQFVEREAKRPFDLATGPVIRATLLRISAFEHVLACYFHHIAVDGWSMGIFGRELTAFYLGRAVAEPVALPPLPVSYADFARWQQDWLSTTGLTEQVDFWREQLRELPTLELPTDRPRPPVQRDDGACHDFTIDAVLAAQIRRFGAAEHTTTFITALAAFAAVMSRWSGERDLPIGTYVANRRRPEWEPLMGFFLNTLVLRVRTDPGASFRELLRDVRDTALDAFDHQDVPFEVVVDALRPARDPSRSALIQVVFQVNNAPTVDPQQAAQAVFDARRATSIYDLAVVLFDTETGIGGQIEYRTSLFDAATIEALADRFVHLLRAAVSEPDTAVGRLPLAPPAAVADEWQRINTTGIRHPWHRGLIEMFDERVEQNPGDTALLTEAGRVTYAALASRAARVAAALHTRGIGSGDVVGLEIARSAEAVAAVLGVLMAGAAWLPLDVDLPRRRIDAMLAAAGASLVLTSADAGTRARPHDDERDGAPDDGVPEGVPRVDLDAVWRRSGRTRRPEVTPAAASDRAYVLFTSGSTGRPKGVAAPHGQILNRLHWMWREYPWKPGEVGAMTTSIGFVDSIWEIFGGLLRGVPTVIVPQGGAADLDSLVDRLGGRGVTRLWLVPSLLRALLDHVGDLRTRLPRLDMWVSSGEVLPVELHDRFRREMPGATLLNLYGTSEVWDATICDSSAIDLSSGRVPIGRPIDNVRVWIVDELDQLVPAGVPGELIVAGAGLMHGYLDGVEPERLVRLHPDHSAGGVRAFRTGDRAVLRGDGLIELLGRRDRQVKVRGVRIELDEVEAAIAAHPRVGGVAVRDVGGAESRLVAWYEPLDDELDARMLREHTAGLVPSAMVPQQFVARDALPRTASGKIDREAVARTAPAGVGHRAGDPPEGATETLLGSIWREVLGIAEIGRDDDFFVDLGGHSLLAIKVVSRARQALARPIPLPLLFEHPTIRGLATALGAGADGVGIEAEPPATTRIPRIDREAYRRRSPRL